MCLVRFALANIRRRPERFVLSVLGIALAIACVIVVRTISASFAITGADSVTDVLGGAQLWAVSAAGVHYDTNAQALVADGAAPNIIRSRRLDGNPRPVRSHRHQRQYGVAARNRRNRRVVKPLWVRKWQSDSTCIPVTGSWSAGRASS